MNFNEIGAAIKAARTSQSRTQAELASALGMSRATISAIENGTVGEIGIRKVIALCNELGLALTAVAATARPTLQQLREERRARR